MSQRWLAPSRLGFGTKRPMARIAQLVTVRSCPLCGRVEPYWIKRFRCAVPGPALPAPGSALWGARPARPRCPCRCGTTDLAGPIGIQGQCSIRAALPRAPLSRSQPSGPGRPADVAARSAAPNLDPTSTGTGIGAYPEDGLEWLAQWSQASMSDVASCAARWW